MNYTFKYESERKIHNVNRNKRKKIKITIRCFRLFTTHINRNNTKKIAKSSYSKDMHPFN